MFQLRKLARMKLTMIYPSKVCPCYKPSADEWLGDMPDHWEVRRLRTVVDMRVSNVDKHAKEDEFPVRLCNYVDVYKHDRITPAMPFMTATASRDEIERFRLERDDVLITKDSEAWDDIGVPALVTEAADDLLSGYHLALLRPFKEILGAYLARTLQSKEVAYQFHIRANGVTRYGLTHTGIKSVCIPLPPLPEQAAIVRYMDYVDRRIRRYVAAKRKLIALLEEEKQAVVNQAVTRGLDPNVRLKPSGVEWLGDVPEHWEVRTLGQIADSFRTGPFGSMLHQSDYVEGGTPVINPVHMRGGTIVEDPNCTVSEAVAGRLSSYRLGLHDLVFSRRGELGRCALVRGRETSWLCGTGSIRVRIAHGNMEPEFLIQALQVRWVGEYLSLVSVGATMANLNTSILKGVPILVPPIQEQRDLLELIGRRGRTIDDAIARARRQIDLVQEYRTRLIADVVTGKLDVREAAAQLPDETDDQDPIDRRAAHCTGQYGRMAPLTVPINYWKRSMTMDREVTA